LPGRPNLQRINNRFIRRGGLIHGRGLEDPIFGAQCVFRCAMMAMARPGTLHRLQIGLEPPKPLSLAMGALALALCDFETTIWLDERLRSNRAVWPFLRFHTGAALVDDRAKATFALIGATDDLADLHGFPIGSMEYPDRSATLVLEVAHLRHGNGDLILSGPGIDGQTRLDAGPAIARLAACFRTNHELFPRGVDSIFVAGDTIAALPRSTRLER
jgi:alpha-D-ribose 1-methylphosphonate 5-triphosphate synthase subunit PhnH